MRVQTLNEPVQGLWIGQKLSRMERLSIASFLANGHPYHLYTYDDIAELPEQVRIFDANQILPSSRIFTYAEHNSYAGFANHFRYELLLRKGGWWADLDMICLRHFDFDELYVFATQHANSGNVVNNCLIKVPPHSPIMEYVCGVCSSKNPKELRWGETGPKLLHDAVLKYDLFSAAAEPSTFCPIPFFHWPELILPGRKLDFGAETYAVHLWNEVWRRFNADKDEEYPATSIYEELKAFYLTASTVQACSDATEGLQNFGASRHSGLTST